eukprot:ctg_713.g441
METNAASRVLEFEIRGLRCRGCERKATAALERVEGVQQVQVDRLAGRARVTCGAHVPPRLLLEAVRGAGTYRAVLLAPVPRILHLQVTASGKDWAARAVEALEAVDGVHRAHVHSGSGRVRIAVNGAVKDSALLHALQQVGLEAVPAVTPAERLSSSDATVQVALRFNCGCGEPSCLGSEAPRVPGDVGVLVDVTGSERGVCDEDEHAVHDLSRGGCWCRQERDQEEGAVPAASAATEAAPSSTAPRGRQVATLIVSGMTCASCVNAIESALQRQRGVYDARVNLLSGRSTVKFDASQTSAEQLEQVVNGIGYRAQLVSSVPQPDGNVAGKTEPDSAVPRPVLLQFDTAENALRAAEVAKRHPRVADAVMMRVAAADNDTPHRVTWLSCLTWWGRCSRRTGGKSRLRITFAAERNASPATVAELSGEEVANHFASRQAALNPRAAVVDLLEQHGGLGAFHLVGDDAESAAAAGGLPVRPAVHHSRYCDQFDIAEPAQPAGIAPGARRQLERPGGRPGIVCAGHAGAVYRRLAVLPRQLLRAAQALPRQYGRVGSAGHQHRLRLLGVHRAVRGRRAASGRRSHFRQQHPARHHHPAGQVAGDHRQGARCVRHRCADVAATAAGVDRQPHRPDGRGHRRVRPGEGGGCGSGRGRRPAARAARQSLPGGRGGGARRERRRRIDVDGRVAAGAQTARRHGVRRCHQRQSDVDRARHRRGRAVGVGADGASHRGGANATGAGGGVCRLRGRRLRTGGHRHRGGGVCVVVLTGPEPQHPGVVVQRPGSGFFRAPLRHLHPGDRLPVLARPGDAHRGHGGHHHGRAAGRTVQGRSGD